MYRYKRLTIRIVLLLLIFLVACGKKNKTDDEEIKVNFDIKGGIPEKIIIDYCAHDRLTQSKDLVSIDEMFFDWASKQPPESLRSIEDNPMALADDMADFIIRNKDMLLAAEAEREELGLLNDEDKEFGMKWFIEMTEAYKNNSDKKIE